MSTILRKSLAFSLTEPQPKEPHKNLTLKRCTKNALASSKSTQKANGLMKPGISLVNRILYQNELFTAIETYQYVANQFPNGEKKYDAKLGILMSYIAQEKYYDAEAIMSVIQKEGQFPARLQKDFCSNCCRNLHPSKKNTFRRLVR